MAEDIRSQANRYARFRYSYSANTATQIAIALAVLGVLATLLVSVLTAFRVSEWWTLAIAIATGLIVGGLYFPILSDLLKDLWEERQRRNLRAKNRLALVSPHDHWLSPDEMPYRRYGFEEVWAVQGLRDGRAQVRSARLRGDGNPYPLEVHKIESLCLVGYVSKKDEARLKETSAVPGFTLWMRRSLVATKLVTIPLDRVGPDENAQGDGTTILIDNVFRLSFTLGPR